MIWGGKQSSPEFPDLTIAASAPGQEALAATEADCTDNWGKTSDTGSPPGQGFGEAAEYMKSKPPNSESKILYLRPFKAYNMLRIS